MSAEAPRRPTIETINSPEALAKRRELYDVVRELFDKSNKHGLEVTFPTGNDFRPHESDRSIEAQLAVTEGDSELLDGRFSGNSHLTIHMRLFPARSTMWPDGISLTFVPFGSQSQGYGGVLLPNGSVIPRRSTDIQIQQDMHAVEVHSAFALFQKALGERRVHDGANFNPKDYDIDVVMSPAMPGLPAVVAINVVDTSVRLATPSTLAKERFENSFYHPLRPDEMTPQAAKLLEDLRRNEDIKDVIFYSSSIDITPNDESKMGTIGLLVAKAIVDLYGLRPKNKAAIEDW